MSTLNPKKLTKVSAYTTSVDTYWILKDEHGFYWGIPAKDFEHGQLMKQYNGMSGFRSVSESEVINRLENRAEFIRLKTMGYPPLVASLCAITKDDPDRVLKELNNAGMTGYEC